MENGADVNAQGGHYGNALTAAARHSAHFNEMAGLFLTLGSDIDAEGPGCYGNPLQTAVWMGHRRNVRFLLENGAKKRLRGQFGSALDIAESGMRYSGAYDREQILHLLHGDESGSIFDHERLQTDY